MPCSARAGRFSQSTVWTKVVPVLGRPTCRKTRVAISSQGALVTLDQLVHLGLVTLGHGQQELGHQIGQLGQPEVEGPALLNLVLEAVHPVAQVEDGHVGELLPDGTAASAEGRLQRSHDTTIRQILEGTTSTSRPFTGPEASRTVRSRMVA